MRIVEYACTVLRIVSVWHNIIHECSRKKLHVRVYNNFALYIIAPSANYIIYTKIN